MLLKHPTQQTILYQLLACLDPIIVSYLHTDFLKYLHYLEAQIRSCSDHVTKVESTSTPDGTSSSELARGRDLQILGIVILAFGIASSLSTSSGVYSTIATGDALEGFPNPLPRSVVPYCARSHCSSRNAVRRQMSCRNQAKRE